MTAPPFSLLDNSAAERGAPYGQAEQSILSRRAFDEAAREIRAWPGYRPTPLCDLAGMSREFGVARVFYKDEGYRFGLKSFKALGGAYAVLRVLREHIGALGRGMAAGVEPHEASSLTVAAATDGNHGRAVAWAAQMFGCGCVIFLHEHVSAAREREISRYGATIRRTPGTYDDSVRACVREARENGWRVIQDTALEGQLDPVACLIMQGYQILIDEALHQLPEPIQPTHIFVPAGVGGLAAAVAGYVWERQGPTRPCVVVVEPKKADCVYRSIAAGRPTKVEGDIDTFMACLAAGEVSPPAWPILKRGIDHVVALDEEWGPIAMRRLASGGGDPAIVAGESGAAAIGGLMAVAGDPAARARIGLGARSIVLAIGSEGATDEETYARVVGKPSAEVASALG
jgi:diaminopropionate ammonia-lyase